MATKIFLTDIDLSKNQLLNTRLQNATSASELNVYIPNKNNDPNPDVNARRAINDPLKNKDIALLYWNTTDKTAYFLSDYTYPVTAPGGVEIGSPTPVWKSLGGSGSGVLSGPVTVSIGSGKWFGKYSGGTTHIIGEAGMTIENFLRDVALESMPPTASISLGSTSITFNPSSVTNTITFSSSATTPGATITSSVLEYQRGGGSWETLNVLSPYSHIIPLGEGSDRTSSFNYKLTVTDSNNQTKTVSTSATIAGRVAPTISNKSVTETREKGDIAHGNSGMQINKNTTNTELQSYIFYTKLNNGSEILLGTPTAITGNPSNVPISLNITTGGSINGVSIAGIKDADKIDVYVRVVDVYVNSANSIISNTSEHLVFTRNLELKKFIGASTAPISNYRGLTVLAGGTTSYNFFPYPNRYYAIAIPSGKTLVNAVTFPQNETITSFFNLSTKQIQDFGGTNRTYNVYEYVTDVPFGPTTEFRITIQA